MKIKVHRLDLLDARRDRLDDETEDLGTIDLPELPQVGDHVHLARGRWRSNDFLADYIVIRRGWAPEDQVPPFSAEANPDQPYIFVKSNR